MTDVYLYYDEDLPCSVAGLTAENPDGTFTILINPNLCYEAQVEAYKHELHHIQHDFGTALNVSDAEKNARQL